MKHIFYLILPVNNLNNRQFSKSKPYIRTETFKIVANEYYYNFKSEIQKKIKKRFFCLNDHQIRNPHQILNNMGN